MFNVRAISILTAFWLLGAAFVNAQVSPIDSLSNFHRKIVTIKADTIQIDSISIVPDSFLMIGEEDAQVLPNQYTVDFANALLIRRDSSLAGQFMVEYRTFPFLLTEKQASNNIKTDSKKDSTGVFLYPSTSKIEEEIFQFDQLRIDGGVGRALSFGNNQDLVVNSNLNLRLSGQLENGVEIVGALTDDNIPFQPEGNSRQIRELDKVFLKFKKDNHQLILGDFEQFTPKSYFLQYNKRLQGVNYDGTYQLKNGWKADARISGAASRGRYALNEFFGEEGNQGPYKLFGTNNESFIIILSGTERVFVDGVLLERGYDRDYVIDYNIGELIFTSRRLINNRSRIKVEFEYTDKTYSRTLLQSEANYGNDKWNFRINLYTEQDTKGSTNLTDTTINAQSFLSSFGDEMEDFFIPSFSEEEYRENAIQYKLVEDTIANGVLYDTVFVYSTNINDTKYRVLFTYVGPGEGDYIVDNQLVNGRVFRWIPPENGIAQGSYRAAIRIVPLLNSK